MDEYMDVEEEKKFLERLEYLNKRYLTKCEKRILYSYIQGIGFVDIKEEVDDG